MRTRFSSLAAIVLWSAASWAGAQDVPPLPAEPEPPAFQIPPGARVRLTSAVLPGGAVEGLVASSDDQTLGLLIASEDAPFGGGALTIPRASVGSLRISMGKRAHKGLGAVFGALALGATGFAAEVDPDDCGPNSNAFCSRGEAIAVSTLGGALLGALVGAVVKTERWQNVSVEVLAPRSAAGPGAPAPGRRGTAVGARVALRF
jgi:hypothetical protein